MTSVIEEKTINPQGENAGANFNANAAPTQKRELTPEQKEKARLMDLEERKSYKNFNMKNGEEFVIRTNLDKMEWREVEVFKGATDWRYVIQVVITDWNQFKEYTWKLAAKHGRKLRKLLEQGYNDELIKVKRIGDDTNTEYKFDPVS